MSAPVQAQSQVAQQLPLPSPNTLMVAAKLAQDQDKPILLDYYADSVLKKAFIGIDKETGDKILIKNRNEFTSLIKNMNKSSSNGKEDWLIQTENSIYIVSGTIDKKSVAATKLLAEADDF